MRPAEGCVEPVGSVGKGGNRGGRDRRLVFLLSVAHRRLQRRLEERASACGVTAAQSGVLFALQRDDGAPIGDLADALQLAPSALTGLVDRMQAAGLVERRGDPGDGRASRIWLTGAGRTALERVAAELVAVNATLMDGYSEAELAIVSRWLAGFQTRFPKPS